MPSFLDMQRRYQNSTVGRQLKEMSDFAMQETWENDIQTRLCYFYDFCRDDNVELLSGYDPSKNKEKIPVKLKFIIKTYKSASKDDPEYHIQFSPDDWNTQRMIPDWFREKYQKFEINFPVGLYVDIPDDRGVYNKWLAFYYEVANQFPKIGVMRCNHVFSWITENRTGRYIRKMSGVDRTQNSYTSYEGIHSSLHWETLQCISLNCWEIL